MGQRTAHFFRWYPRNNQELGERIILSDDAPIQGFMPQRPSQSTATPLAQSTASIDKAKDMIKVEKDTTE